MSEDAKVQALMPTMNKVQEVPWCIDAKHTECCFNHKKIPKNVCGDKRDKWNLLKVNGFMEWNDREKCSALCDAGFSFVDGNGVATGTTFLFSLSYAFSKSAVLGADGMWRSRQQVDSATPKITCIEANITEDPRVVQMVIFYMYTELLLDVHTLTNGTCDGSILLDMANQYDIVSRPDIGCDLMEVYKLACFLDMKKLMSRMRKYCLMPSPGTCPFETMEMKLACVLARCDLSQDYELAKNAAETYVRYTKGLSCLCRWPLIYSQAKWDLLMKTARQVSHHWFAHVVPLYVYLYFPATAQPKDIVNWASTALGLEEAMDQPLGCSVEGMDMRYCLESNEMGLLCLERVTTVPHVRSLAKYYRNEYGIDLAGIMGEERSWVLPWAHMLGACAQIHAVTLEKSIGSISPSWLQNVCIKVVERYGRSQEMTGEKDEEVNMICKERKWILDRMLLGPATGSDSADQAANNLECSSSKDLVVLQVSGCINRVCRRMGCLKDISCEEERKLLPLYYMPQVLDAVSDALSMAVQAKISGFSVRVTQTSRSKKRRDKNDKDDLGSAMDFNGVLNFAQSTSSPATKKNRTDNVSADDQGGLW